MKVLVTGANGQLGWDMILELKKRGHEPIATDILDSFEQDCEYIKLDITDEKAVHDAIAKTKPDAVVHCAAWTAVDAAEDEENKPKVYAINVLGTKYIAEACKEIDCKMIYISTDYVFSGEGTEPWEPDCEDFAPLNYYGETKLEGEFAVKRTLEKYYIVRTSWVFGSHGNNFVKTMLRLAETHKEVRVVNDQTEEYGISKAKRPKNSRMGKSRLPENGFALLSVISDCLKKYIHTVAGDSK